MTIERMTALGSDLPGLRASPAMFSGDWKPLYAQTMPETATAVKTALQPFGVKPPLSLTLLVSKCASISAPAVRIGTTTLKTVIALFVLANSVIANQLRKK